MQLEAMVIRKLDLEQGVSKTSGNPWSKATLIVEVGNGTQYPKKVALINMSKAQEFYNLELGKTYSFSIDIESREFNNKWYSDIRAYAWNDVQASQPQPPTQTRYAQPQSQSPYQTQYQQPPTQVNAYPQPQDDNIPF